MKIAVVYNRESRNVINLFGMPNREKIGLKTIRRLVDALRAGKHQVTSFEGDKHLIEKLEEFMPRVVKGELPGMVFNVSYGIQGQARYTHIPSLLEMVGIPYVGSGPLAHSLALDKVVTKMILQQHGLPTPEFAVLDAPGFDVPDLPYPLIVKPKNEAVSFGIRIVHNNSELREAADVIFEKFQQPVLAERYISGREINVGILGNSPPETFPPAEILFGEGGPPIYTVEDKKRISGREIKVVCPAVLNEELYKKAQAISARAFAVLGCLDCARVDMRLDEEGNLYILEINSLPSLGEHGSYLEGAREVGMDFTAVINRMVESASSRYFGTPLPPAVDPATTKKKPETAVFEAVTNRRDLMERRLKEWVGRKSRSQDPVGVRAAALELDKRMKELGLSPLSELSDQRFVWTYQTRAGLDNGVLLMLPLDVPLEAGAAYQPFRRAGDRLFGEGVGASRASLVMMEFALRSLRQLRKLKNLKLGVLAYADEGLDCRFSEEYIRNAGARAREVLVLRAGNKGDKLLISRRGLRRYRLSVTGVPRRVGKIYRRKDLLRWFLERLDRILLLSSAKDHLTLAASEIQTQAYPMFHPHAIKVTIVESFKNERSAKETESKIRGILGKDRYRWDLEVIAERPPMPDRKGNQTLRRRLIEVADQWDIPLGRESSIWPSAAGLIPSGTPVVCGLGPVAEDHYTPQEVVHRISLIQRTLLLAQYLLREVKN